MINSYNKLIFIKKTLGKVFVSSIFASLLSSSYVFATPNDNMPTHITQKSRSLSQGLYNGYKGYRHHRPGYQRHSDGWWYPDTAFKHILPAPQVHHGVNIDEKNIREPLSNNLEKPRPSSSNISKPKTSKTVLNQRHVKWCSQQYKTYRASDNSFAIKRGERRRCVSPFSR